MKGFVSDLATVAQTHRCTLAHTLPPFSAGAGHKLAASRRALAGKGGRDGSDGTVERDGKGRRAVGRRAAGEAGTAQAGQRDTPPRRGGAASREWF